MLSYAMGMNLSTIRMRLAKANLSKLALKSGVSLRTLRRLKNGKSGTRVETAEKLAKYLWR